MLDTTSILNYSHKLIGFSSAFQSDAFQQREEIKIEFDPQSYFVCGKVMLFGMC